MADSKPTRRDFLQGRAALGAAADAVSSALEHHFGPLEACSKPKPEGQYLALSRQAMACQFEVRLNAGPALDTTAPIAALDVVEQVEDRLTVYRNESDLLELNRAASKGPVPVDDELWALLQFADDLHKQTHGAFDPTSGPLSRVWGFHQRNGAVPSREALAEALQQVGWDKVELSEADQSVQFLAEGIELNANSLGKGYALDQAGQLLIQRETNDWLIHGGRSTLLAAGSDAWHPTGGWLVGLRDPLQPDLRIAELRLCDQALSTSGQGTQYFEHEGRKLGHVIDPRTGWPAEGLHSVSVVAPTGIEADALSTALYVLGLEGTADFCSQRPDIKALVVCNNEQGRAQVHAFNLEESDWQVR